MITHQPEMNSKDECESRRDAIGLHLKIMHSEITSDAKLETCNKKKTGRVKQCRS